ncbi:MAG: DUF2147 domain-containing protein [Chitinophagales bacterium]
MNKKFLILILMVGLFCMASAKNALVGVWYNTDKSAKIEIIEKSGKFYGNIIWLEDPLMDDGTPKINLNSPEKSDQDDPIIGLQILWGFEDDGDGVYKDGKIYDPENGKTYKCKMTLEGDELDVRGYIGIPALGRTENWTRVE